MTAFVNRSRSAPTASRSALPPAPLEVAFDQEGENGETEDDDSDDHPSNCCPVHRWPLTHLRAS
jgi:hypothetical protein